MRMKKTHSCFVNSGILTHTVCNLANINNRLNSLCLQYFLEPQGVLPVRCYWGPLKAKPVHRCSAPCACYWLSAVLFTSSPCNWHFSLPNWPALSTCHISGTEMPEYPEVPCSGFSFFFPYFYPSGRYYIILEWISWICFVLSPKFNAAWQLLMESLLRTDTKATEGKWKLKTSFTI